MSNLSSCGCPSTDQFGLSNFTFRSNTSVNASDKDLSNFLSSPDYKEYKTNFPKSPIIKGQERLVTFNNTTIQALWLPAIISSKEKQILFTFYNLGKTNYLTFVINSKGNLSNLIDLSGTFSLMLTNKVNFIKGTFSKNEWNTLSKALPGTPGIPPDLSESSIASCFIDTVSNLGIGSAIACGFDPEVCFLAIAIDCAASALL